MRHRFLPRTAGERQNCPLRVLAPHRGLESIGSVLRLWFPAILGSQDFPRVADVFKLARLFNLRVQFDGLAGIVGDGLGLRFGSRSSSPRCLSGFDVPNHRPTPRRNVDMFNGHFLLAFAAVFVQDPDRSSGFKSVYGSRNKVFVPATATDPMATPTKLAKAS